LLDEIVGEWGMGLRRREERYELSILRERFRFESLHGGKVQLKSGFQVEGTRWVIANKE
jgi:hypothetical protein